MTDQDSIRLQDEAWRLGFNSGKAIGIKAAALCVEQYDKTDPTVQGRGVFAAAIRGLLNEPKAGAR